MRAPMITLAVLLLRASAADAARFEIVAGAEGNVVVFESKAPMETFRGRTDRVDGEVTLDPASVGESLEIRVRVDLASLDTGIGLRDRHMRTNHLHTDRFPYATFTGAKVVEGVGADLTDGDDHELLVEGMMDLHGVARPIRLPLRVRYEGSGGNARLHLHSEFRISLPDHEIPRPRFLLLKLNEVQGVQVDVTAVPAGESAPGEVSGTGGGS